jgi:hypothetical protein
MDKEVHPLFSDAEQKIWHDTHVFPAKRQMLVKLQIHFSTLQVIMKENLQQQQVYLPENAVDMPSRISKGENLDGYPWLVLDYPRCIQGQDIFLFRTLAWFGHGFSCSLIMQGKYCYPFHSPDALEGWHHILQNDIWNNHVADGYAPGLPIHSKYEAIRVLKPLPKHTPEEVMVSAPKCLLEICKSLEISRQDL